MIYGWYDPYPYPLSPGGMASGPRSYLHVASRLIFALGFGGRGWIPQHQPLIGGRRGVLWFGCGGASVLLWDAGREISQRTRVKNRINSLASIWILRREFEPLDASFGPGLGIGFALWGKRQLNIRQWLYSSRLPSLLPKLPSSFPFPSPRVWLKRFGPSTGKGTQRNTAIILVLLKETPRDKTLPKLGNYCPFVRQRLLPQQPETLVPVLLLREVDNHQDGPRMTLDIYERWQGGPCGISGLMKSVIVVCC